MNKTIRLPAQHLSAQFALAGANSENRTVPLVFYSGSPVLQFSFEHGLHNLQLSMDPKHVNLGRLNSGTAPFTMGHADNNNPAATIGVITNARIETGQAKANARFSKRADVEPVYQDVLDGVLTNVSVGASVHKLKEITAEGDTRKTFLATSWVPFAVALVGVGADPKAHFTASASEETECEIEFAAVATGDFSPEGTIMENIENGAVGTATVTTPSEDAAWIRKVGGVTNLKAFAEDLIARGVGRHEASEALLNKQAELSSGFPIQSHHVSIKRDQRDGLVEHMSEALACRYTGKEPSERAREFAGARICDMAREICLANNIAVRSYSPERIIRLAHSTSDFPNLVQSTGNRMLLQAYEAARPNIQRIARRSTAPDFRMKSALRLGGAPSLEKIPESGEVTHGTRGEAKESYRLYTYGRMFAITREALVNDDLSAFSDFASAYGRSAANLEGQLLVDLLASNPTMTDLLPLFDAGHANMAGSGAVISDATLTAARLALRTQKDLDGVTVIETAPKYLVVPAAIEHTAELFLAKIVPAQAADVNPFAEKFELIVVPQLDAHSITAWYIFGDPAIVPAIEYSYLDGQGLQVEVRQGWETLGTEFRAILDYGVGAIGHRGCYMNAGA